MMDWFAIRHCEQISLLTDNSTRSTPPTMAFFMPPFFTVLVACAPIFYVLFLVCRHLSFPLGSIPGPLLARFTDAWYLWKVRAGDFHHRNQRLHDIYGTVFFHPKYPHGNLHLNCLFPKAQLCATAQTAIASDTRKQQRSYTVINRSFRNHAGMRPLARSAIGHSSPMTTSDGTHKIAGNTRICTPCPHW
jgi:hypothetical protein